MTRHLTKIDDLLEVQILIDLLEVLLVVGVVEVAPASHYHSPCQLELMTQLVLHFPFCLKTKNRGSQPHAPLPVLAGVGFVCIGLFAFDRMK